MNDIKYWQRGGYIGLVLGLIITLALFGYSIVQGLACEGYYNHVAAASSCPHTPLPVSILGSIGNFPIYIIELVSKHNVSDSALLIIPVVTWGILGMLGGWMYSKVKKRS